MSFYQNPFNADFIGTWVLGDRQYSPDFRVPRNAGRGDEVVISWAYGPYDLSGNDADGNAKSNLVISFAINDFKNWADVSINISGATPAATTATEVAAILQANSTFNDYFTATSYKEDNGLDRVRIIQKLPALKLRFYIKNGRAEQALKFNARAGVAELPTYFSRHTVTNRFAYTDAQNALVELTPGTYNVDAAVINNAVDAKGNSLGYSSGTVQADYLLLQGRSGLFTFRKTTLDGSSRPQVTIEYPAGARAGDLAKRITYKYSGATTTVTEYTEEPYKLTSGDIVTPV